ncbi:MAG: type II CAAX endopeptidase family protein [Verrucomicrobiae bacterium]|nr:type II CAAX endopeptidase family protein [Verrucomicrobiae bacterium]
MNPPLYSLDTTSFYNLVVGCLLIFALLTLSLCGIKAIYAEIKTLNQADDGDTAIMDSRAWNILEVGFILLWAGFLYSQVSIVGFFLQQSKVMENVESEALYLLIAHVTLYSLFFAAIVYLLRHRRISWSSAFGFDHGPWNRILLASIAGLAVILIPMGLASSGTVWALEKFGWPSEPQFLVKLVLKIHDPWVVGGLVCLAVIGAPLFEEILFRGVIYPYLRKEIGFKNALWINSALFACVHLNLTSLFPLFLLSLMFNLLYEWKRNLAAPILCHALFNALSLLYLFT